MRNSHCCTASRAGASAVILVSAGHLYETASFSGTAGLGLVVEFDNSRNNPKMLYNFPGGDDESGPEGALLRDKAGNLTYMALPTSVEQTVMVVFELTPQASAQCPRILISSTAPPGRHRAPHRICVLEHASYAPDCRKNQLAST